MVNANYPPMIGVLFSFTKASTTSKISKQGSSKKIKTFRFLKQHSTTLVTNFTLA